MDCMEGTTGQPYSGTAHIRTSHSQDEVVHKDCGKDLCQRGDGSVKGWDCSKGLPKVMLQGVGGKFEHPVCCGNHEHVGQ